MLLQGDTAHVPFGHGGFAMGTALGANRRKYHTVLNAAANPPVDRIATIAMLDETLYLDPGTPRERALHLVGWRLPGTEIGERTSPHLVRFEKDATTARWTYEAEGARVVKELRVGWRKNTATVRYLVTSARPARLDVTPWAAVRDFHDVRTDAAPAPVATPGQRGCDFRSGPHAVRVASDAMRFVARSDFHPLTLFYDLEQSRRLGDRPPQPFGRTRPFCYGPRRGETMTDPFNPTPEHAALREMVRDFVDREVAPQAAEHDRTETFNRPLFNRLGELGLLGITVDEKYGGSGMDAVAVTWGAGEADALGDGEAAPPMFDPDPGRRTANPVTAMTMTAAAASNALRFDCMW